MSSDVFRTHHTSSDFTDERPAAPAGDGSAPDIADAFVFRFDTVQEQLGPDQRWSSWLDVERGCRGPEPRPDWVVTEQAAIDTELGILKTGKEADVFLLERAVEQIGDSPARRSLLAAKRYRTDEHRSFHRSASYVEGRRVRNSRDSRAMAKKSAHGKSVAAGQWAYAEWEALCRLWKAGVPVPYPVQVDGTELLMEFIDDGDGGAAPRLAQVRPKGELLASYFEQLRDGMRELARAGLAHGDLSPYNVLAQGDRIVMIDLPQVVDIVGNPKGMDFLMRDCHNMCTWFTNRGLETDEQELFADLLAMVF
ncbi:MULTISPECIES: serine protein kinase RIO [unclassified Streptomyces]|uniref:serine protein kinase RIO n=1 Tax=unclassified Streptomyces TaxID=2593676 RepID=UPI00225A772D|nr:MULTISPECIES: RIO1 family regulatory kinase/ATPase [unclassified Streptomyces]MCX5141196.1 serine/threonine protein kinase [Streptomyces sp. NBC_00338]WRZ65715.1 serine/threonine protein kinase [Streptomyces sp. NBC_01257]